MTAAESCENSDLLSASASCVWFKC